MTRSWHRLESILAKACEGRALSTRETTFLLELRDDSQIDALFRTARELRRGRFADRVFLYGFLYVSTYCRNNCTFCSYRRANASCRRYRKEKPEIVEAACRLATSGVHLIDLTMGEDPLYFNRGAVGLEKLVEIVRSVRETAGLPVMVSPGAVPDSILRSLAEAGATWYACYQETCQRALFAHLRPGQSYDDRLSKKKLARTLGLLVEEGMLSGVGESTDDVSESISAMRLLDADQVRAMSFVPQAGTPMENWRSPDTERELKIIAVLRLTFPDRLIPASLDVGGLAGLKRRLDAGANVVTSLVPPNMGFAGVAQGSLDINDARRTCASVEQVLETCGLSAASAMEYAAWIDRRWEDVGRNGLRERVAC